MLTADDRSLLQQFNKNVEWLKGQQVREIRGERKKLWGTYDEVCEILRRSKSWYQQVRNQLEGKGYPRLHSGEWRRVGKEIEYFLPAIERMKEELIEQQQRA